MNKPKTHLYKREKDEKVIYDNNLSKDSPLNILGNRYWEVWLKKDRENPLLVRVVEELGERADGRCAELKIVKIPDDIEYTIEEYDGLEHIAEAHKTWR